MTQLVHSHISLVHAVAAQVKREVAYPVEGADLVGYGAEGLIDAAARFESGRGLEFITYAHWRVRGAMLDGVRRMIGLPRRRPPRLIALDETAPIADGSASADDSLHARRMAALIRGLLPRLPARERHFIEKHYFEGKTLLEAGAELGLSKSWSSRIHGRAIERLRKLMRGALRR